MTAAPIPHPHTGSALLRTGVSVSADDGRIHAIVELHGELCASTATGLRSELAQLVDDGIVAITVDLRHLRLCTSHGLDVFEQIDRTLRQRPHGCLRVHLGGAAPVVACVVRLINDRDPAFSPEVVEAAESRMS